MRWNTRSAPERSTRTATPGYLASMALATFSASGRSTEVYQTTLPSFLAAAISSGVMAVAGGAADAFIGVIGINALKAGTLALITGSSHLHIGITDREIHASGLFGSYPDAILPGLQVIEAGQISTGSVLHWFTSGFVGSEISDEAARKGISVYDELNLRAASITPGSEGLVVLEHWQGNRTPWTDPLSRGVIRGLSLSHSPAHVYRAILEGVAYGTEVIFRRMEAEGVKIDTLIACGGATQSDLWMQIHADVSGIPLTLTEVADAPALGSAILAAVAAGHYASIEEAVGAMVKVTRRIEPNMAVHEQYKPLFAAYERAYPALRSISG